MPKTEKIMKYASKQKTSKILPFCKSQDVEERAAAAAALGMIDTDESFNQLIFMLHDKEVPVKVAVAKALGAQCRLSASEFLRHEIEKCDDAAFRAAAQMTLNKIQKAYGEGE